MPGVGKAGRIVTINIDGSYGEGGGQILRTSLALACLTGRAVAVREIRARRSNPGLAPQHLTAVRAAAQLCRGTVVGDELRSTEVAFRPGGPPRAGEYMFDIADAADGGSAGSVTLLAQALLPPLAASDGASRLKLRGGTHVRWSPSHTFFQSVYLPALRRLGFRAASTLNAWGFYPAGGGEIELTVEPWAGAANGEGISPREWLDRGELQSVRGEAVASNLPAHIPQRMTDRSRSLLSPLGVSFDVTPRRVRASSPGAGLFLVAQYEGTRAGFDAHGEKGRPSEEVAEQACQALLNHHERGSVIDQYLADQLLLPLALTPGQSSFVTSKLTDHLKTNAHVIHQFLPAKVAWRGRPDGLWRVEVNGVELASIPS